VPTDAYKYTIGVLLQDSYHPAFPQLQDMQNPTNLIVKERNKEIIRLEAWHPCSVFTQGS
jgi:hypothetical protein